MSLASMTNTSNDYLLLRTVVDQDFRGAVANWEAQMELPTSVEPQDVSFVELVKADKSDMLNAVSDSCRCTCISGLTIKCDGTTL